LYSPVEGVARAQSSMLRHLVRTFFQGSVPRAVSALLGAEERLTREELDEIARYVEAAREEAD
ncbi:MAG TPA: BlaI/MecI/CopY family transcriptional regulator, partial [Longimicrobiales bacterium]|nr:BlaI/MecI/CopY family transcriptional regulator [Longimicrobiales bacterium]